MSFMQENFIVLIYMFFSHIILISTKSKIIMQHTSKKNCHIDDTIFPKKLYFEEYLCLNQYFSLPNIFKNFLKNVHDLKLLEKQLLFLNGKLILKIAKMKEIIH
ncbi:hypothetical protein RFI_24740 [Reticulomyxa filosa]|uniref:Uncharacterized protein n=1 Tax=Reticulomyxa filosa TaxID=46433 RepID=X6MHT9_RETFI|nr:hypothetical protein RFI_24740 [Reticulomyxa filosa]|eukprot:ETO12635.1 hypothetical protein RFI_24740 [Reticulomyxa filosa]